MCDSFMTPWTAACQASLSVTISQSFLKLMSTESVIPSNHSSSIVPFSSCLQSFPASGSFLMSQLFASGGQSIGVSASASFLPMNIQDLFPLGLTVLISLQPKSLSRVFSNITVQKHQFFSIQPSLWANSHIHTRLLKKTIALTIWTFVSKVISLPFNMLSRFVIAFLPGSKVYDYVFHLWFTVFCGLPNNSEGKTILPIDKKRDLGGIRDATCFQGLPSPMRV